MECAAKHEGIVARIVLKRLFDIAVSAVLLLVAAPLLAVVASVIKASSPGPVLYCSQRVGKDNRLFTMYKFRTMRMDTPQVATHLLQEPQRYLVPLGGLLRRTSLDELPQLINILKGDMSLVGPRPALFNQHDLVALRTERGVHRVTPGLTGWAQVNGRDELPIPLKVQLDLDYCRRRGLMFDLRILFLTAQNALTGRDVSH